MNRVKKLYLLRNIVGIGKFIFLIFAVIFGMLSYSNFAFSAQVQSKIDWEKNYPNSLNSVLQTTDGGFILVGTAGDVFRPDLKIHVVKVDNNGNQVWERFFKEGWSEGKFIKETTDGNYIVFGTCSVDSKSGMYIIKIDSSGQKLWEKKYPNKDIIQSVDSLPDGGYLLAGIKDPTVREIFVAKIDNSGEIEWENTFGSGIMNSNSFAAQSADGNYVVISGDWLFKADIKGNIIWEKDIRLGLGLNIIQHCDDGGFLLGGTSSKTGTSYTDLDYYLRKIDSSGNMLWEKTMDKSSWDNLQQVIQIKDKGYLLVGSELEVVGSRRLPSKNYVYLVQTDFKGNKIWETTIGGEENFQRINGTQGIGNNYVIAATIYDPQKHELEYPTSLIKVNFLESEPVQPKPIRVFINNEPQNFEVQPIVDKGRTLVPFRAIAEALGATVDWDARIKLVTLTLGQKIVKLKIGNLTASVNGKAVTLDVPAKIINGRTLVPIRFISESLGAKVGWDGITKIVNITTNN